MSDAATKADAEFSSACEVVETSDDDYSEDGSISMVSEELELGDEIMDIPLQPAGCELLFKLRLNEHRRTIQNIWDPAWDAACHVVLESGNELAGLHSSSLATRLLPFIVHLCSRCDLIELVASGFEWSTCLLCSPMWSLLPIRHARISHPQVVFRHPIRLAYPHLYICKSHADGALLCHCRESDSVTSHDTELAARYLMPETDDDDDPSHLIMSTKRRRTVVDYKV